MISNCSPSLQVPRSLHRGQNNPELKTKAPMQAEGVMRRERKGPWGFSAEHKFQASAQQSTSGKSQRDLCLETLYARVCVCVCEFTCTHCVRACVHTPRMPRQRGADTHSSWTLETHEQSKRGQTLGSPGLSPTDVASSLGPARPAMPWWRWRKETLATLMS